MEIAERKEFRNLNITGKNTHKNYSNPWLIFTQDGTPLLNLIFRPTEATCVIETTKWLYEPIQEIFHRTYKKTFHYITKGADEHPLQYTPWNSIRFDINDFGGRKVPGELLELH